MGLICIWVNMPKPYYWTRAKEARLLDLWKKGIHDFQVLSKELGRKPRAIEMKLKRLGVVVFVQFLGLNRIDVLGVNELVGS